MKKSTYQKPELTIVSFKSERGFATSTGVESKQVSFSILNWVSGSDDASTGADFSEVSSDGWSSGWSN